MFRRCRRASTFAAFRTSGTRWVLSGGSALTSQVSWCGQVSCSGRRSGARTAPPVQRSHAEQLRRKVRLAGPTRKAGSRCRCARGRVRATRGAGARRRCRCRWPVGAAPRCSSRSLSVGRWGPIGWGGFRGERGRSVEQSSLWNSGFRWRGGSGRTRCVHRGPGGSGSVAARQVRGAGGFGSVVSCRWRGGRGRCRSVFSAARRGGGGGGVIQEDRIQARLGDLLGAVHDDRDRGGTDQHRQG